MRRDGILNIDEKMKHRRALLGDDVLLLVPRHRVLLRASGDILHVVGVAGVSDEKVCSFWFFFSILLNFHDFLGFGVLWFIT